MLRKIRQHFGFVRQNAQASYPKKQQPKNAIKNESQQNSFSSNAQKNDGGLIFYELGYDSQEEQNFRVIKSNQKVQPNKKYFVKWKNGTVYEGEMSQKKMNGKGKICYPNGDYYQGQFFNNMFHGTGGYYYSQGDGQSQYYEGQWYQDKKQGHGKQKYTGGVMYSGQFFNNMKNGYGFLQWLDGSYYEGNFNCQHISGNGKMKCKDGKILKGQWKQGKLVGQGIQIKNIKLNNQEQETRIFQGNFENGKKCGKGKLSIKTQKYADQQKLISTIYIQGVWVNDLLQGKVKVQDQNKIVRSAKAINDQILYISDIEYQQLQSD